MKSRSRWSAPHDGQVRTVEGTAPPPRAVAIAKWSWRACDATSTTEQLHAVGQDVAQRESAAMDPRLDGAKRDPGHLGDLGVVVPLDVVEHDRSPLGGRDACARRRARATARSSG